MKYIKSMIMALAVLIVFTNTVAIAQTNIERFRNILVRGNADIINDVDIDGDMDVDGTANLDVTDIDGAVDMATTATVGTGLTVTAGGATVTAGDVTVTAGDVIFTAGGPNLNPQAASLGAGFSISTTTGIVSLTSSAEVTSSTTTGIVTSTATSGDVLILANNNASDVINIDGTGGTIECKANVALGASDTIVLWYNGTDSVWNCLANYDNS